MRQLAETGLPAASRKRRVTVPLCQRDSAPMMRSEPTAPSAPSEAPEPPRPPDEPPGHGSPR